MSNLIWLPFSLFYVLGCSLIFSSSFLCHLYSYFTPIPCFLTILSPSKCMHSDSSFIPLSSPLVTGVLAQSVERPPHNREEVGSNPSRVIPKYVKRRKLMLPCQAFSNKGESYVDLALLSGCRAHDQLGKRNFHFRFNNIWSGL